MTASQDIKTPTMNLPILETVSDDRLKTFCQSSTRLVLSQVLDDVHVFERLSPKTSETNYSRQKTYTVRLNLFPRSDYEAEYSIQPEQIFVGITKTFVPMLDKAILKEIKQNDKEIKSQAGDMGKGKKEKKRGGKSSGADEDGAGEADAGVVGRDDGEEIDGDADDERRQRQGDEEATYDEDEDDDKEDDAEEALEAKFKEDDEDRESSDEDDSDSESEDEEVVAKRSKAESLERMKQLERRVGESSRYITKLTFDKEKGEYCEFELEVRLSVFFQLHLSLADPMYCSLVLITSPQTPSCRYRRRGLQKRHHSRSSRYRSMLRRQSCQHECCRSTNRRYRGSQPSRALELWKWSRRSQPTEYE